MIYPLGCFAFWVYGFAIGWGNWWNGPVPPGWYASLGPGCRCSTQGWGIDARAAGVFKYGLIGTKGFFLDTAWKTSACMALFFFMMVFMDTTATIPTGVDGRALGLEELLPVRSVGRAALLHLCQLGLGRRLARSGG